MRIRKILAATALLASLPAFAQTEPGDSDPPTRKVRVIYKEVEEITFEPVEITTEKKKVPGILFLGREDQKYPSMIDERVHFKRDLAKSARFEIKKSSETAP